MFLKEICHFFAIPFHPEKRNEKLLWLGNYYIQGKRLQKRVVITVINSLRKRHGNENVNDNMVTATILLGQYLLGQDFLLRKIPSLAVTGFCIICGLWQRKFSYF